MNWVAENHYARIVHQERLSRASGCGQSPDLLQVLLEALSALRARLAAWRHAAPSQRRISGAAHPFVRSAQ